MGALALADILLARWQNVVVTAGRQSPRQDADSMIASDVGWRMRPANERERKSE